MANDPRDDYYNRSETQDYGRDYGAGREGRYSSARDYQAAGQGREQDRGGERYGYGQRDYGHQRYGQREQMNRGQDYGRSQDRYGGDRAPEYHGSYGSDGRRFEDVGRYARRDDDNYSDPDRAYERGDRDRGERGRDYGRQFRGYAGEDRGFMARAGDEVRSWFGDEDAERRREMDARREEGERQREGYTGGGLNYRDNDHPHDRDYHSWRQTQIDALDRDYAEYRRENQSKFHSEFSTWRTSRQGQRDLLKKVTEHMEVVGADGKHVGTVDKVQGDQIKLTKQDGDAGGHHHMIPSGWLQSVDGKVTLSKSSADAQAHWREVAQDAERGAMFGGQQGQQAQGGQGQGGQESQARDAQGRVLNRSFSGTY